MFESDKIDHSEYTGALGARVFCYYNNLCPVPPFIPQSFSEAGRQASPTAMCGFLQPSPALYGQLYSAGRKANCVPTLRRFIRERRGFTMILQKIFIR
jgi:hypothetical protein